MKLSETTRNETDFRCLVSARPNSEKGKNRIWPHCCAITSRAQQQKHQHHKPLQQARLRTREEAREVRARATKQRRTTSVHSSNNLCSRALGLLESRPPPCVLLCVCVCVWSLDNLSTRATAATTATGWPDVARPSLSRTNQPLIRATTNLRLRRNAAAIPLLPVEPQDGQRVGLHNLKWCSSQRWGQESRGRGKRKVGVRQPLST